MESTNIKISIITINLNNKSGLINTLNSILLQSDISNVEWIFLDGQSSDTSFNYVKETYLPFKHILLSEKDNGIYFAMNKGIELATGDLLIFLNSGDTFIQKNCIKLIIDSYRNNMPDVMLFGFKYQNKQKLSHNLFWRFWGMPTSHQAIIYKKEVLLDNKFNTKYKLASDYDNFMKLCNHNYNIVRVNEILVRNEDYGSNSKFNLLKSEYKSILIEYSNNIVGSLINSLKFRYLFFILKFKNK